MHLKIHRWSKHAELLHLRRARRLCKWLIVLGFFVFFSFSLSLYLSHFCFFFSAQCVNYIFSSASSSHLRADPPSVLSAAAGRGRMEVCTLLLERGVGLETANRRGMVPLLSAAKHGHTQVWESAIREHVRAHHFSSQDDSSANTHTYINVC